MNRILRVLAGVGALAASFTPAGAAERGAGAATGTVSCDSQQSSIVLSSDGLLYGDTVRAVAATVSGPGDCRLWGNLITGPARLTGDGIACGTDPAKPFGGHFYPVTPGGQILVAGGFHGTCVVDGTERESGFAFNGLAVDGKFVGILMPTGDWPTWTDGTVTGVLRPVDQGA